MRDYITPSDITNKIFNRFSDTTKQMFVDIANNEIEDIAKRKGVDPADIVMPIHFKLKQYATHYAVSQLAQENIGFNAQDGMGAEDVYLDLFKREEYILQNIKKGLNKVMFTGEVETVNNRATYSQQIIIGR